MAGKSPARKQLVAFSFLICYGRGRREGRAGRGWNGADAGQEKQEYFRTLRSTDTNRHVAGGGGGWHHPASCDCFHGVAQSSFPAKSCPFPSPHPKLWSRVSFRLPDPRDALPGLGLHGPFHLTSPPIPTSTSNSGKTTDSPVPYALLFAPS